MHHDQHLIAAQASMQGPRLGRPVALVALCALAALSTACSTETSDAAPVTAAAATSTTAPASTAVESTSTTAAPTTTAAPEPRVAVAKGTFADEPGAFAVTSTNADGTSDYKGVVVYQGDLAATAPFTGKFLLRDAEGRLPFVVDFVVEGTVAGVGEGTFAVHEEGVIGTDGSTNATGTVTGLTGAFEGATGTMVVTSPVSLKADYEFTFTWD